MPTRTTGREVSGKAPMIGDSAPDFVLNDEHGRAWQLSDQHGKVVVLLFYPQNETVVCTRQLCSVRDNWREYLETKAVIVGISPASPEEHLAFSNKRGLPIPLLADKDRAVTRIFGKHWMFPINLTRAVVVIDAQGIVRNRDTMLRAFRPSDTRLITDIYAARGDALSDARSGLRGRLADLIGK